MPGFRGLDGRRVLLTGGASGIGRATACRLGEEGCVLAVLDLDAEGGESAAEAIREAGGRATFFPVDITDAEAVGRAIKTFEAAEGPIDGLVNNAGWDRAAPFLETDVDLWQKVVEINLFGPLHVTHAVLAGMVERRFGRIVFVASDAGRVGSSGEAVYAACKGGVAAFGKSLAREVANQGVTLNTLCPGPTDTPLFASFDPTGKLAQALERAIPMKRLGRPDDYPGLIAFLLSDDAAFLTGQTVSVSGGLTMHG